MQALHQLRRLIRQHVSALELHASNEAATRRGVGIGQGKCPAHALHGFVHDRQTQTRASGGGARRIAAKEGLVK